MERAAFFTLDAVEWVELLAGLSGESRFHGFLDPQRPGAGDAAPATVPAMSRAPKPLSPEQHLAGLRRHRGEIVVRGGAQ